MKKALLFLFTIVCIFAFNTNIYANVYASGIKISHDAVMDYDAVSNIWDGDFNNGGVKIWFIVNEAGGGALSAEVTISQGANVVRVLNLPVVKGVNSVIWDGWDSSNQPAPQGSYTFEITIEDPVGHTGFDSLWAAGAAVNGPDFDGGTSYAYRGTAANMDESSSYFGNIYVARGTSTNNGIYEIRADGAYLRKVGTDAGWGGSTPNEVAVMGNTVYGLRGYGFTGAGPASSIDLISGNFVESADFQNSGVRDLTVRMEGNDTVYYTARSGAAGISGIVKKVGALGDTVTVINLTGLLSTPTTNGYVKSFKFDDAGNVYVAYGDASASRKKIAKFDAAYNLVWNKALDTDFGLPANFVVQAIAIAPGATGSADDDQVYFLTGGTTSTAPERGIYRLAVDGSSITHLSNTGSRIGTAATSLIINVDPAQNVVLSNGSADERIVVFSPAYGPNSYTTANPTDAVIVVTQPIPVELTSFTASVEGAAVSLNWRTATETNNKGFEIEKKINNTWSKIGYVDGKGTTTQAQAYSFTDTKVQDGKAVYRLKQIDLDGSYSYSKEVEVDVNTPSSFDLSQNYPNPFNPATSIKYSVPADMDVTLQVFTLTGELVETLVNGSVQKGSHSVQFNASNLASGTYIYRLTGEGLSLTKKMLLMK